MLFKSKPSLLDALRGREATLRTTGHTGPVQVSAVHGKKLTIEFPTGPRTGAAVLTCAHPDHGLVTVRGTTDRKGVLTVKDVETEEQRRAAYRVRVTREAEVTLPSGEQVTAETTNLSVGGVRLRSCPRLRVDDQVRVRLCMGTDVLLLKAVVARAEPNGGCGLRFLDLRPGDDQIIGRHLADLQRERLAVGLR